MKGMLFIILESFYFILHPSAFILAFRSAPSRSLVE